MHLWLFRGQLKSRARERDDEHPRCGLAARACDQKRRRTGRAFLDSSNAISWTSFLEFSLLSSTEPDGTSKAFHRDFYAHHSRSQLTIAFATSRPGGTAKPHVARFVYKRCGLQTRRFERFEHLPSLFASHTLRTRLFFYDQCYRHTRKKSLGREQSVFCIRRPKHLVVSNIKPFVWVLFLFSR